MANENAIAHLRCCRATGIDLVSDGEMSKISRATYLKDRLNGFEGTATKNRN
ncbi:MAG: hypothetical protein HQ502_19580 [Alphaproteobacteria bacterium]|nr:hypothetical protein [Alphaproteobacteria bacterium]